MLSRRLALVAALLAGAATVLPAMAKTPAKAHAGTALASSDMSLGDPHAKVHVIEYASLSCPHCARFNQEVFPAFKAKYVDTGQVRYTMREMLTPPAEVAAAGFMLARCAGPSKYFKVVDEVFKSQSRWNDGEIKPIFLEIAKNNGMTEAQFEACINSQQGLKELRGRVEAAVNAGVNSTPTFVINGKKHEGEMTLQELDAAIAGAKTGG
jgi:protein-disulfide isomerase